jgi:hypothetical protein
MTGYTVERNAVLRKWYGGHPEQNRIGKTAERPRKDHGGRMSVPPGAGTALT